MIFSQTSHKGGERTISLVEANIRPRIVSNARGFVLCAFWGQNVAMVISKSLIAKGVTGIQNCCCKNITEDSSGVQDAGWFGCAAAKHRRAEFRPKAPSPHLLPKGGGALWRRQGQE